MTNQIDKEFNTSEILADQNTADTTGIQIDSEPTSAVEDKSIETHENGMERDLVAESEDRKIIIVPTNQVEQGTSQSAELVFHNRPSVKTMTNNRPTSWSRSDPSTAIRPSKLRQSFGSVDENDIETVHRPKRHCWCFKSLLLCIGVILVILAGLGLLIFFLFPAPPGIEVSDPFQPPGSAGFLVNNKSISELSPSILQEPMLILSIGLATNVKFNSTSYITFGIRQIDVTVYF